jgi:hypothetical protein
LRFTESGESDTASEKLVVSGHPTIDIAGAFLSYRSSMKMRLLACTIALLGLPLARAEEPKHQEPVTIVLAVMSGKCTTLKVAGRDFRCRAIAFFQTDEGRANFVIALDDPADNSHIITFSGDNGRRPQDNLYELPIDRMLLKSKDRPKVDGLPVAEIELSAGMCKQVGNFATRLVSSISCSATDKNGQKYDLQYESDGSPIEVRRVRQTKTGRPAVSPFD